MNRVLSSNANGMNITPSKRLKSAPSRSASSGKNPPQNARVKSQLGELEPAAKAMDIFGTDIANLSNDSETKSSKELTPILHKNGFTNKKIRVIISPGSNPATLAKASDAVTPKNGEKRKLNNNAGKKSSEPDPKKSKLGGENKDPKQQSLTSFFTSPSPPSKYAQLLQVTAKENIIDTKDKEDRPPSTPVNVSSRMVTLARQMDRSLATLNHESFAKELKLAVKLPVECHAKIKNPFVKYLVQKEHMRTMSKDEKQKFLDEARDMVQYNPDFNRLFNQFKSGKCEDLLTEPRRFCLLNPVPMVEPEHAKWFGRCLVISQFLASFQYSFFARNSNFRAISAQTLLSSMDQGKSGGLCVEERVVKMLADFLASDAKIKPKIERRRRSLRSREILRQVTKQPDTLELVKLLMVDVRSLIDEEWSVSRESGKEEEEQREEEEDEANLAKLECALSELERSSRFYQLSVESQLQVIEYLIDRIISLKSFADFLDAHQKEGQETQAEVLRLGTTISELNKSVDELATCTVVDDNRLLTRQQIADIQRNMIELKLKLTELAETKVLLGEKAILARQLKFTSYQRAIPLGTDRFYRNYWLFGPWSPNRGIFVEQKAYTPPPNIAAATTNGNNRGNSPPQDYNSFIQKLREELEGRLPSMATKEEWYWIGSGPDLEALMECLSTKGVRESVLKQQINSVKDIVLKTFENEEWK